MLAAIQQIVRTTDAAVARLYLSLFRERNALMCFLFHSLFRSKQEIAQNLVDPRQGATVSQFRQFVEYYLKHGYRFISPLDLTELKPDGKYALITFDDGYFNNSLALPILEEYGVPAVFFITTENVRKNKSFWWDVLYRERASEGADPEQIRQEGLALKSLRTEQIQEKLAARFGPEAFTPRSDIDRPFSPEELKEFSRRSCVHLGNHTANHAILTNYTQAEVRDQVLCAQESLQEMTGVTPSVIAYPNGARSQQVLQTCHEAGLKIGFTTRPEKNFLPLDPEPARLLHLGRFCPQGLDPIISQCQTYRSELLLYGKFRNGYMRLRRGSAAR